MEQVALEAIAQQYGTPCYIYSQAALLHNWRSFTQALNGIDYQICYAVKANSNIALLNILAKQGAGFDIVSLGELERVRAAGAALHKVVFSGVGKR